MNQKEKDLWLNPKEKEENLSTKEDYKQKIVTLECQLNRLHRRHTKIVSQLHEHIDKYRKQMINCLNMSIPDMIDQIDL